MIARASRSLPDFERGFRPACEVKTRTFDLRTTFLSTWDSPFFVGIFFCFFCRHSLFSLVSWHTQKQALILAPATIFLVSKTQRSFFQVLSRESLGLPAFSSSSFSASFSSFSFFALFSAASILASLYSLDFKTRFLYLS